MGEFHVHQSEDAIYKVYKITGPTGKVYIGCTKQKPEKRWKNGNGYRKQPYFFADIEKFGWDTFKKEIVCEKLLKEGAENLEKLLVEYYDTCDPDKGYNVFSGGARVGCSLSPAGRARDSRGVKMAYANDPEYHTLMKVYARKKFTEHPETLQKARESHKKMWNDEYRRKKSKSTRKYFATHEHNWEAKAVICVETGEVFRSQGAAERATGVNHGGISGVCRGLLQSAGGLHWEYWQRDKSETG